MKPNSLEQSNGSHEEIQRLLPWYATHSLAANQVDLVEKHLIECEECKREVASCRSLADNPPASFNDSWSPSPRHFASILERVDAFEETVSPGAKLGKTNAKPGFLHGVIDAFAKIPRSFQWTLALETATCVGLILALTTSLYNPLSNNQSYQTLSNDEETFKVSGTPLRVLFADDMTTQELAALLKQTQAQIKQGPSAVGSYVLEVPEKNTAVALAILRSNPKVQLAQQIDKNLAE